MPPPSNNVDPSITKLLNLPPTATMSPMRGGGASSASTFKIVVPPSSTSHPRTYFLKTARGPTAESMFRGEHASLCAIHDAVPSLCPRSFGWGEMEGRRGTWFVVTEFVDFGHGSSYGAGGGRHRRSGCGGGGASGDVEEGKVLPPESLARKLARLHSIPAPPPPPQPLTSSTPSTTPPPPQFGFPVPTSCGNTLQDNTFHPTWSSFYANSRLRFISRCCHERNGADAELEALVEYVAEVVVPRLLGEGHLGGGKEGEKEKGVVPVVCHGDLWSGNRGRGVFVGRNLESKRDDDDGGSGGSARVEEGRVVVEDIVFDSSASYAHSEFDLGIMRMFGGFGEDFFKEYHGYVPKTELVEEYADRVRLYEVYHHLNHHAIFGGSGYRGSAVGILRALKGRYG